MKPHLLLQRFYTPKPEWGTFGKLELPSGKVLYTVEQPWNNNTPYISCVPEGEYELVWFTSPKYGKRLHLKGHSVAVTQAGMHETQGATRFSCLLHAANLASELQGCIGPGEDLQILSGVPGTKKSAVALAALEAELPEGAYLTIAPYRAVWP